MLTQRLLITQQEFARRARVAGRKAVLRKQL